MNIKVTVGIIAGAILVVLLAGIGYYNSVQKVGLESETSIVAQNNANTIALNQFAAGMTNSVQLANLKSGQLDKIIKDAVSGRYQIAGNGAPPQKGALFSAIREEYPTLDLYQYDQIIQYVQAKRDEYAGLQTKLQDQVANFNLFLKSGFPHAQIVHMIGFPDSTLQCQDDRGHMLRGQACLDLLLDISQPNGSNNGGGQNALQLPANN